MPLVERFIEFDRWPTSRKTALIAALALPAHIVVAFISHKALASTGAVDVRLVDESFLIGALALAISLAASVASMRAGRDGGWTAYLLLLLYGGFNGVLLHVLGYWSTGFFVSYPMAVILVTLWFGERVGWTGFAYGLILTAISASLDGYAPGLIDRSIDVHRRIGWKIGTAAAVMGYYVFCFVLSLVIVAARRTQDARLRKAQHLISRYIPSQLTDKIIRGEHTETFKPERTKVTVFFSDVEGFTEASDHLDPEDLAALLNEYLSEMVGIAERHGATINQIVGDGIMAFFGAPQATSDKDHALRCVRMAMEMQRRMVELKGVWIERGIRKPFRARIGINTGHASVGDYGSPGRKLYSAIGVQTNLAARIQTHCEPGKILISHSTRALVHEAISSKDKGELELKGVHYPVRVYEVLDPSAV